MTHSSETNFNAKVRPKVERSRREKIRVHPRLSASLFLLILPVLYILTLAQSPVLGDPSEYTFVANMLGIAHPPGYAFITLVGKLFQTAVPIGLIAWRMHLLAAVSASLGAWFIFGIIKTLGRNLSGLADLTGLFGAFLVGTSVNYWQHAIHANPHILTATFMAANLYFLTRWWASEQSADEELDGRSHKWLYAFCVSAGLGITHHPLTVFGFPAYGLFILWVRPSILKEWRTLLKMIGFALLGLSIWLYFPIRSPMDPGFGPTTMNTLNGFLDHVLARGLSDSLPYFALADQPDRARVFWSLLRLQYTLPIIGLAIFGLIYPFFAKNHSPATNCPIRPHLLGHICLRHQPAGAGHHGLPDWAFSGCGAVCRAGFALAAANRDADESR